MRLKKTTTKKQKRKVWNTSFLLLENVKRQHSTVTVLLRSALCYRKGKLNLPHDRLQGKKVSRTRQNLSRRQVSSIRSKSEQADMRRRVTFNSQGESVQSKAKPAWTKRIFVRVDEGKGGFTRNERLSLFLLPAACSVNIITVHVSPTAADWLQGRDQEKVTAVKLSGVTTPFPITTSIKNLL